MTPTTSARFSIAAGGGAETVVIRVHGALDDLGAANLQQVLDDILADGQTLVVQVDLRDVRGIDLYNVAGIAGAARRARRQGGQLTLIDPPELLCEALEAEGLTALIRMVHQDRRPPWSAQAAVGGRPRRSGHHPSVQPPVGGGTHGGEAQGL